MAVEFIQCRNPHEVKEEAERLLTRLNNDVKNMICSGFQKMSQRQEFQNLVQDVIRKIERDDLDTLTVMQETKYHRNVASGISEEWYTFTYPHQEIKVASLAPSKYQLPAYFDCEIDFSIFMYGLLEALNWTGGATVEFMTKRHGLSESKLFNSNRDFLQFLAQRYGYNNEEANLYAEKRHRDWVEQCFKEGSADLHIFYYSGGFFKDGAGAKVCNYGDPYSTEPKKSLISTITLYKSSLHLSDDTPDTPKEPKKSWY